MDRFPGLGNFIECYWEAEKIGVDTLFSPPAPSSYWMKGYVILEKEVFNDFKKKYKWDLMDREWRPSFHVDAISIESPNWGFSNEFNNYIKTASFMGEFYLEFNNGIIYFEVVR